MAARYRAAEAIIDAGGDDSVALLVDDPDESFVMAGRDTSPFHGELVPIDRVTEFVPFQQGEAHWTNAGAELPYWAQPEGVRALEAPSGAVQKQKRKANGKRKGGAIQP